MTPERIARVLGVRAEEVRHHLVTLPAWDPRPAKDEPHGRPCVRVTALARRRVLRAAGAALEAALEVLDHDGGAR